MLQRLFSLCALVCCLSSAARAQTAPAEPVEPVPTLDIQGVNNASARRLLKRAFELPGRLWEPILSPDGTQLVCGNFPHYSAEFYRLTLANGQVQVKRISDATRENNGHKGTLWFGSARAFSPDGKIFATGSYGRRVVPVEDSIQLWDTKTWREIGVLKGHPHTVNSIAFSPDGKKIISGNAGSGVIIYDVATRSIETAWMRKFDFGYAVNVAFWNDRGIFVPLAVVRKSFPPTWQYTNYINAPQNAVPAPRTEVGDFEIWNIETNQKIKDLQLPGDEISLNQQIHFSADGRLLGLITRSNAPETAKLYQATVINWTTGANRQISFDARDSDFSPLDYTSLRFLPDQDTALLCDTAANRLATFDVMSLYQPPARPATP